MVTRRRAAGVLGVVTLGAMIAGCGPRGRDVFRDFNSRETGPWLSLGRAQGTDGTLVVHVAAANPQHAEGIARHVVAQNVAMSVAPIRIVVDPASGNGDRHVYRWDGKALTVDTDASGLPPRAASPPAAHGE